MSHGTDQMRSSSGLRGFWPWMVLAMLWVPAIWHVVDFEEDLDAEFPQVIRPTFNRMPPSAYRLAEPGDTLDRVMLYVTAASLVLATAGLVLERGGSLWPAASALALAALWYSSTPGPTVDGWHGLGWRTIYNSAAPTSVRLAIVSAAVLLIVVIGVTLVRRRDRLAAYWAHSEARGTRGLFIVAVVLLILGQFDLPGVEPQGYWPRWSRIGGFMAFALGVAIELGSVPRAFRRRWLALSTASIGWLALVVGGIWVTWYHRPLARFKEVVPGRIYMSAMPTRLGIEVATARHPFRTIINLFPERTAQRSPILPDELAFVRAHNIRYLASPSDPSEASSNAFLDETLALAQDPSAWPILVHCHGCMDRTPAWVGIYRFVVQQRPLLEIMQEIERHRGYRPKASVTLLYNRVLPPRSGARYWADPTAMQLRRIAGALLDPMIASPGGTATTANPGPSRIVPRNADATDRLTR